MNTKKIIVDILLFILMIVQYSRQYLNPTIHEIIGICLIVLVIFHLYFNRRYLKGIRKGKYNRKRSLMLIINIAFMIVFMLTCILGLLSSQIIHMNNLTTIYLHKILAYLGIVLLGLHLSFNINILIAKIPYKKNNISNFNIIWNILFDKSRFLESYNWKIRLQYCQQQYSY